MCTAERSRAIKVCNKARNCFALMPMDNFSRGNDDSICKAEGERAGG